MKIVKNKGKMQMKVIVKGNVPTRVKPSGKRGGKLVKK